MVDYPEEVENKDYIKAYTEKFNANPIVKDNNLLLVNSSINSLKNFLIIFCFLIVIFAGVFCLLVYQGYLKPEFKNTNQFLIQNNISSYPVININNSEPVVNVNINVYPIFNETSLVNITVENDTA